ncbi:N-acetylglucosamine-6-phosphate deacetylase [Pseudactinotalea sp. Z1739]|uniref:N-acetylglucosamine-6-phosphate deacetylase n=1 Tax=Pseudactinotalea sp. Z1739 TaxID=3413028 RepID=UPI003C7B46B8
MTHPAADVVLRAPRMITDGAEHTDGWVAFTGAGITAVGTGAAPDAAQVVHGTGLLIPGLIDIHCHGGAGGAFAGGTEAIDQGLGYHRRHGTTRSVLSMVTATIPNLRDQVSDARQVCAADPLVLGIHLEGPWLSPAHRGAHDQALLREPTEADIDAMLTAADGYLAQVTIAPELTGAHRAIEQLLRAGVRVAVGHSAVDYDQAGAAFDAGASILTHAFNAMAPIHHRAPGPVLAATERDGVTCEVINDGVHVHPRVVRLLHEMAPGRIAYVTDAMAAAGCADGAYELGGQAVTVTDGVPRLDSTGSIAGSTLTMDAAVRQAVRIGIPLPDAIQAATSTPARTLGLADRFGSLAPGYAADAVLLDTGLQVEQVWADGTSRHQRVPAA